MYSCSAYGFWEPFLFLRRLNFTLRHMDVSCEAYDHFRHCLDQLGQMTDGKMKFTVEAVKSSFAQFFQYERVEQLVRSALVSVFVYSMNNYNFFEYKSSRIFLSDCYNLSGELSSCQIYTDKYASFIFAFLCRNFGRWLLNDFNTTIYF